LRCDSEQSERLTKLKKVSVKLLFPEAGDEPKQRGRTVECRHRLGGLLKYYARAA
jgi:hypothetical protein